MIGDVSEHEHVLKFWNAACPIIQKGLWRDNLNPETSSWDKVVAQAKIIEISEGIAEKRDHQANTSSQGSLGHQFNDNQSQFKNKSANQSA